MDLKITSLNVRGICDNMKRKEVFNWLRAKKYSIYMLQEARYIVRMKLQIHGPQSGATKHYLAVARVGKLALLFFSTTILTFKFLSS